jgi:hypothetical protein
MANNCTDACVGEHGHGCWRAVWPINILPHKYMDRSWPIENAAAVHSTFWPLPNPLKLVAQQPPMFHRLTREWSLDKNVDTSASHVCDQIPFPLANQLTNQYGMPQCQCELPQNSSYMPEFSSDNHRYSSYSPESTILRTQVSENTPFEKGGRCLMQSLRRVGLGAGFGMTPRWIAV